MNDGIKVAHAQVNSTSTQTSAERMETSSCIKSADIPLHPLIIKRINSAPPPDVRAENTFFDFVQTFVNEMQATTYMEQEVALDRAYRTEASIRLEQMMLYVVDTEMTPAAIEAFRKHLDPTGEDPFARQKAKELAKKNHIKESVYDQDDLEEHGSGLFPIETEAFRRAQPNLIAIQKMLISNEKLKIAGLKSAKLMAELLKAKNAK